MKILTVMALILLSMNIFAAEIENCKIDGTVVTNVVVLNNSGVESIQKILDSKKSEEEKRDLIKRVLYIETVSIADGKSICELATTTYNVSEEKCMSVMKSRDLMESILEDSSDIQATLACKIGVTSKLQMQFNM